MGLLEDLKQVGVPPAALDVVRVHGPSRRRGDGVGEQAELVEGVAVQRDADVGLGRHRQAGVDAAGDAL